MASAGCEDRPEVPVWRESEARLPVGRPGGVPRPGRSRRLVQARVPLRARVRPTSPGRGTGWREYGLAVTASLLTLYAAELAVTPRLGTESVRHDGMLTKLHVITALRARGVEAFPAVYPFLFRGPNELKLDSRTVIPLGGVADATTVLCNEANQIVVYQSD